jgi:hypothetical protein
MNLGRGAEDSSMTRLCSMFRLTVNRVHTQLVPRRLGHANQYGRRSCPTSGWLARLLTHAQWCDVCLQCCEWRRAAWVPEYRVYSGSTQ